jgi:hypothetical protein
MLPSLIWPDAALERIPWPDALPLLAKVKRVRPLPGGLPYHLDPAGLQRDRDDILSSCSICSMCLADLRGPGTKPPKYSLANGLETGEPYITHLPPLTWMEEAVISRVRFSSFVVKLEKHRRDSQLAYTGHVLVFPQDPDPLLPSLPRAPVDLVDMVQVILLSANHEQPTEITDFRRVLSVSRSKIRAWLHHLKMHNPLYHEVALEQETLDRYPEGDILMDMARRARQAPDPTGVDAAAEEGIIPAHDVYVQPPPGMDSLRFSVVVDENGRSLLGW